MRLTRRQELSLRDWGPAPPTFKHAETPGKPLMPALPALAPDDAIVFSAWLQQRESGNINPLQFANVSQAVKQAQQDFEKIYFKSPDYSAWGHLDTASRDSQYRFHRANVHRQIQSSGAAVKPVSADPKGLGQNTSSGLVVSYSPLDEILNFSQRALDISATAAIVPYNVPADADFYITEIRFSTYAPTGAPVFAVAVSKFGGVGANLLFSEYMPQTSATQQVANLLATLTAPILIPAGSPVNVGFILVAGTATGALGSFFLSGELA